MMPQEYVPEEMFEAMVPGRTGESDRRTLSFSRAPTVLIAHINNRSNQLAADDLRSGPIPIGMVEFKLLVNLARYPDSTVTICAERLGIDKAAVSRSLAKMHSQALVQQRPDQSDERKKVWALTGAGYQLHDYHAGRVIKFQIELLAGLSVDEIQQLNGALNTILQNIERLSGKAAPDPAHSAA